MSVSRLSAYREEGQCEPAYEDAARGFFFLKGRNGAHDMRMVLDRIPTTAWMKLFVMI